MFTGIITQIGTIASSHVQGDLRLRIAAHFADYRIGESIACNGACLTVVEAGDGYFDVELSQETLTRTAPRWGVGARVNLERALKMGDALDGHMVTGHVDALAKLHRVEVVAGSHVLELEVEKDLSAYLAEKGSVTLDGVSLTVNKVEGARFWVNIIPHTWQATTLGERKAGDVLNCEIDIIARYVARMLQK
jgi:riboflavin synthase